MAVKVTVSGFQGAKAALLKELKEFAPSNNVLIGIQEGAGEHEGGISNAQLGAVLHFGAGNIPARPWLDAGVLTGNAEYAEVIGAAIKDKAPLNSTLDKIGLIAVARAQQYMVDLKIPANKQATINAKGSSNPLIDTGQLMQSVTYKVTTGSINES